MSGDPFGVKLLAGGLSGVVTKTAVQPLERVKTILQIQGRGLAAKDARYSSILRTFATVVREEGFIAMWKGNTANCVRIVPVYALRFGVNDHIKQVVAGTGNSTANMATSKLVLCGTIAGFIQQVVTYPLELIKSRMTLDHQVAVRYKR